MRAGPAVEFGDEVPGWGDHDCVEPSRSVGSPSREGILRGGGEVADMNAAVIKVEVECLWFAFSEGERCCRFGGSVKRCSSVRRRAPWVCVCDVAKDAAGADRGELLIISDKSDVRTAIDGELDSGVQGQSVGHTGLVNDHQR
jgi:hypothetical protein